MSTNFSNKMRAYNFNTRFIPFQQRILITKKMHAPFVCIAIGKCYRSCFSRAFFSVFIILLFRVYFLHFTKISRMPNAKADGSLNTSCIIIGSMQTRVTDEATNEQKKIFFHFSMLRRECEYKVNARLSTAHTNDDVSLLLDFSERNFFQHFLPWKCVVFS